VHRRGKGAVSVGKPTLNLRLPENLISIEGSSTVIEKIFRVNFEEIFTRLMNAERRDV
jgi:hypothetical protein